MLGGVEIPFDRGLDGHSDADVVLHALGDALLGAVSLGDIGHHFPPTDPAWEGADSGELLSQIVTLVREGGYRVVNCDLTVLAEAPKLSEHRERMCARIAEILGVAVGDVSVKATTHEQIGTIGRGEGIAAHAVALLATVGEAEKTSP